MPVFWITVTAGVVVHLILGILHDFDSSIGDLIGGYLSVIAAAWLLYTQVLEKKMRGAQLHSLFRIFAGRHYVEAAIERGREVIDRRLFSIALVAIMGTAVQSYGTMILSPIFKIVKAIVHHGR